VVYFSSQNIAAIAIIAALWGVLNSIFSPIFFQATGLPFLCDSIGFSLLSVAVWWTKKFGVVIVIGLVASGINFIINPGGIYFLGFVVASIVFDTIIWMFGYNRSFRARSLIVGSIGLASIFSAGVAGYLIGSFLMPTIALTRQGGVLVWAGLHAFGGVIGGAIGIGLILTIRTRLSIKETRFIQQNEFN